MRNTMSPVDAQGGPGHGRLLSPDVFRYSGPFGTKDGPQCGPSAVVQVALGVRFFGVQRLAEVFLRGLWSVPL